MLMANIYRDMILPSTWQNKNGQYVWRQMILPRSWQTEIGVCIILKKHSLNKLNTGVLTAIFFHCPDGFLAPFLPSTQGVWGSPPGLGYGFSKF